MWYKECSMYKFAIQTHWLHIYIYFDYNAIDWCNRKKFDQSYESVTEVEKNAAFHMAMFSIYWTAIKCATNGKSLLK